ncbi:helix-turn-helix domain-containing protein [Ferruginibacter paludis]|uniref:helix-turn-helix domain-containing protein n=1 Tax=Ferruginibacter paludis TaxID=1310417 RepID=UPI0025B3ED60|nr:helix-turn-helix domain-containing protein [Ferruginibacter paludis]MDN3657073.1 helix-turn-helix domain-containing protein [Ferruginibacter paludis]
MQTNNPFDLILSRLDQLQTTVNTLSEQSQQSVAAPYADPDRLLDLTEAAAIVRKPVGTVRHYIHHRNLPAIRIGKSYLIKLSELLHWVNRFKDAAETTPAELSPMLANRKRYAKSSIQLPKKDKP